MWSDEKSSAQNHSAKKKKSLTKENLYSKDDWYNYSDSKNVKKFYLVKLYLCISHSLEYILFSNVKLVWEKQFANNQPTSFLFSY